MRLGFVGPAGDQQHLLREAAEFLLGEAEVDQALYLGPDDLPDRTLRQWSREILGSDDPNVDFLQRAATLAKSGTAVQIRELLRSEQELERLWSLRKLPAPPARAIEMVEDRIVIAVHDKALLDEEDIANADVVVYGKSDDVLFKRFGPRCFFTPGPLAAGKIGLVDVEEDGRIGIALFEISGTPLWREILQPRQAKMTVTK